MTERFDLLILGGGVIGLSCAIQTCRARRDWRIAILSEPAQAGTASVAAAGMLAPFTEAHGPGPFFELCLASFRTWPKFAVECARGTPVTNCGTLRIPRPDDEGTPIGAILAYQNDYQFAVLAGPFMMAAEPALSPSIDHVMRLPEMLVNAKLLHANMLAEARSLGIKFLEGAPVRVERSGAEVGAMWLKSGEVVEASRLVLATGAWSESLGDLFGVRIPMIPMKGQVTSLVPPRPKLIKHMINAKDIYLAPRSDREILIGATMEAVGFDLSISEETERDFVLKGAALVPELADAAIESTWVGFRPRTPDGLPVIGRAAPGSNLWIASGHFRNGILLAPITGELIASSMMERGEPPREFSPDRFA